MNTVLVVLACMGRFCDWTPMYVVPHETQAACQAAIASHSASGNKTRAQCVPALRK